MTRLAERKRAQGRIADAASQVHGLNDFLQFCLGTHHEHAETSVFLDVEPGLVVLVALEFVPVSRLIGRAISSCPSSPVRSRSTRLSRRRSGSPSARSTAARGIA
jgi:hypothetical protein